MKRFLKACLAGLTVALTGLVSTPSQATPVGCTTLLFSGNCIDCSIAAGTDSYAVTGELVLHGDVAIRMGSLDDSGLIARKLEDATLGLFAAPGYLGTRGICASVERNMQPLTWAHTVHTLESQ